MCGVIGGNGVAATNRLCDLVERKLTRDGAFRDAHHPEMIVWQATSAPSRSMFLEGRGPNWIPAYVDIAKKFRRLGCKFGCMCCNTAHYAIDEIVAESGLPFINLLEEVALAARRTGLREFEIFCSDGARKHDLYGKAFAKVYPEARIVYPTPEGQRLVTETICGIKNKSRLQSNVNLLRLNDLVESATAPVILGCTDLRVAYDNEACPVGGKIAVDSLECLADALISWSHEEKWS